MEKRKKRTRVDLEFTGSFRYQVISYNPEHCKALREVTALHLVIMNFYQWKGLGPATLTVEKNLWNWYGYIGND